MWCSQRVWFSWASIGHCHFEEELLPSFLAHLTPIWIPFSASILARMALRVPGIALPPHLMSLSSSSASSNSDSFCFSFTSNSPMAFLDADFMDSHNEAFDILDSPDALGSANNVGCFSAPAVSLELLIFEFCRFLNSSADAFKTASNVFWYAFLLVCIPVTKPILTYMSRARMTFFVYVH